MAFVHTVKAYGLRKDGTLGPEEEGKPVALFIESVKDQTVDHFIWSDQSVGPADAILLPVQAAALTWREPFMLTLLMLTGLLIGLLGLALVPLSWVWPSLRTRSNCLFHAYGRLHHEGGYLIFTPSKHGWYTHVIHSLDLQVFEEYYPLAKKRRHWFPPVTYRGLIQPWVIASTPRPVAPVTGCLGGHAPLFPPGVGREPKERT